MSKNLCKLLAVVLALTMCMNLMCTSIFAADDVTTEISGNIDKSANGLDENDQTDVTLTVPSVTDALGSDIIYIIGGFAANKDGSPIVDGDLLISSLVATMREMVEAGTHVNFGMVPYSSDNVVAMPLTRIDASNIDQLPDMIAAALATCESLYDGVNMENALRKAKKLFSDPTNPLANHPERQHLVMISSGFTYYFNTGDNNEWVATVPVRINDNYLRYTNRGWMQARTGQGDTYPLPKAFSTYNDSRDWDLYWSYIDQWARADIAAGDEVVYKAATIESADFLNWYSSGSGSSSGEVKYITGTLTDEELAKYPKVTRIGNYNVKNPLEEPSAQHAILYERAMWEAYEYAKADITGAGINFYPIYNELKAAYTNGYRPAAASIDWTTQYIGHSFMNMLAGGEAIKYDSQGDKSFFKSIEDQILYTTAIGSTVEDFIGKNENGNFEFIEDAACITLNVGGKDYTTAQTSDTEEGSSYAFTAPEAAEPTFWLDYTYGDGETTEKFIWTFGENVSLENIAKLTYKLQLTEKLEAAG
ncbi:MAG: VWA domain-containing protein, partial [Clostridia bacterium]|nr:VWA domain-containing protein [Clostridia bacterium]